MARDISQRAKPDVRPLKPRSLCIYCGEDAPPATTLTGDVPSQHLMRPVQSAGRRCQGHPTGGASDQSVGKQYACAERRTVLIIPSTRSFPCTSRIWRSRVSGHQRTASVADIGGSKSYLCCVPGPTCRGSVPLCMPPFSYQRGGMQRYKTISIGRLRLSSFHSNRTHSGVGYYAPAARTTLNPRVLLCVHPLAT